MKQQVGLFGGTFNPIHFGHISLACELKEKKFLDEIWFVPSLLSPFRTLEPPISSEHRLNMLSLALRGIPGFNVCDLELKRSPPSYTVDTIKEVLGLYPDYTFFLLLGEDSLMRFHDWKEPLEIVKIIPLLIGSRPSSNLLNLLPKLDFNEEITAAIKTGLVVTRQIEISSTEIRDRIKKKLYCRHLLPGKSLDYIYENQLYSMPR